MAHISAEDLTRRRRYDNRRAELWNERSSFESHWRELAEFFSPRRPRWLITDRNRGDNRSQQILDSTAVFARRTLQSGLHAGLTSPARPWMRLTTANPSLAERPQVREWLHEVTERMLAVFGLSNLYNVLPTLYGDLATFGTAAMGILEDEEDVIRAYCYPIGSYACGFDARGKVNVFLREYELSLEQAVEQFGERKPDGSYDLRAFSTDVQTAWANGHFHQPVQICWMIERNPDISVKRPHPWRSVYFQKASGTGARSLDAGDLDDKRGLLRDSGFYEFPVMVTRWEVTGEDAYGTDCPGMTALGDCKQLQIETKRKGQAIEKGVNPPLQAPTQHRTQQVSSLPGGVTFVDGLQHSGRGVSPVYEIPPQLLNAMMLDIQEVQFRIKSAFYEPLFLMLASDNRGAQPITAREVDERHEEKLIALGPVLERTNDELLDPLVDRVYGMMERSGLLPDAPQELSGVTLPAEYISILSQAQKLVGVLAQDRFLMAAGQLAQVWPDARHKVNSSQAIDDYARLIGVNPELVRSDEEAAEIVQAEQQALMAAQQAQEAKIAGDAAKSLAGADMSGDNALTRLVGGA